MTSFSLDPYQIGYENEEAISSGAFWFYRKLGFRSTDPALRSLTDREESRLAADPAHRTSARLLRRLSVHNMLYDVSSSQVHWDRFHVRNIALAVLRRMRREDGGDASRIRAAAESRVSRALGIARSRRRPAEQKAFSDFALVLALIPDLPRWSRHERDAVAEIVLAKAGPHESRYLRLMQRHARLRAAILALGSSR